MKLSFLCQYLYKLRKLYICFSVFFWWCFLLVVTDFCCPVSWGSGMDQLHFCWGVRPPPTNECPGYDTKQSDGEAPVRQELLGMWSTPSLPLLSDPLWPGVVAPNKVLSLGKKNCILMLNWITWNRTVLTFKLRTYTKLNCLK